MRIFPGSISVLAALVATIFVAALPASASAAKLVDPATGVVVTAPSGFQLTQQSNFFTIKGKSGFAVFATGASPLDVPRTGAKLVASSKGKLVGKPKSSARAYRALLIKNKRFYVLRVRSIGAGQVEVALYGPGARPGASAAKDGRLVQLSPAQLGQIAALERIIATRRGAAPALLNVPVPMRLAQTDDNSARANVPSLPDWTVSGGNGLFAISHPTQGFGLFGSTYAGLTPAFPYARPGVDVIVNNTDDPVAMFQQFIPQWARNTFAGQAWTFTDVQAIPGTQGSLGASIPSSFIAARYTVNGRSFQSLWNFGITNQTDVLVKVYFSMMTIADDAPGGISNALLQSWASASGEVGFRQMFSTTLDYVVNAEKATLTPSRFRADTSTWIDLVQGGQL